MRSLLRPKASEVLTAYLKQCNEPMWTSYFVRVSINAVRRLLLYKNQLYEYFLL